MLGRTLVQHVLTLCYSVKICDINFNGRILAWEYVATYMYLFMQWFSPTKWCYWSISSKTSMINGKFDVHVCCVHVHVHVHECLYGTLVEWWSLLFYFSVSAGRRISCPLGLSAPISLLPASRCPHGNPILIRPLLLLHSQATQSRPPAPTTTRPAVVMATTTTTTAGDKVEH